MWHFFVCIVLLLGLLYLFLDTKKPSKFPPGPKWMPVLGNFLEFRKLYKKLGYTHLVWETLSKRYGELVGLRMGRDRLVIVSGIKAVRQVLTREEFDARPDGFFFRLRSFGQRLGLVFVDGNFFNVQKKFCMRHLRSFGLNQRVMEDRISLETSDLVAELRKMSQPVMMPETLEFSVLNSLWLIVAGQRFAVGDKRPMELLGYIHICFRLQDMSGGILNQMPFLRHIAPEGSSYNQIMVILKSLVEFFQELVDEHRENVSSYENRDLIDAYLQEMGASKDEKDSTFSEEQLIVLLLDLFLAGAETTSSTLGYAILYLIHHPNIQDKLQNEMDNVVGSHQPCIKDKPNLPYMEAFLMELQRHANVTPTTVSHRAKCDTTVNGCFIPRDTIVLANLYSLHMDNSHWGDPEVFRPERFLNENGKVIQDEWLLPFGIGKRRCMGEALARASMFLFTTALLHNFNISPIPGEPLPPLDGHDGATISPKSFKCIFSPRD